MRLSEAQSLINKFTKDKGLNSSIDIRIIDLTSEVGELSKEILKSTNYGCKEFEKTEELSSEIGDVLFSLICIANETESNLEECIEKVLKKYGKRFENKGDLGSGR